MGNRLREIHDKFPASLGLLCRGPYPACACFHWLGKASSTAFTTLAKRHRSGRDGHSLCGLVIPNSAMGDSLPDHESPRLSNAVWVQMHFDIYYGAVALPFALFLKGAPRLLVIAAWFLLMIFKRHFFIA
jgi:hypothetical protein